MQQRPKSFEEAYTYYQPLLKSQMKQLNIYKNHDEFYQTALIALWNAYQKFDNEKGTFPSYAYQHVRGALLSNIRKDALYSIRNSFSDDAEHHSHYEHTYLEKEIVESYCTSLSHNQKTVIIKRFYEQKTFPQIAKEEGVKEGTVRSWYRYALNKLQKEGEN